MIRPKKFTSLLSGFGVVRIQRLNAIFHRGAYRRIDTDVDDAGHVAFGGGAQGRSELPAARDPRRRGAERLRDGGDIRRMPKRTDLDAVAGTESRLRTHAHEPMSPVRKHDPDEAPDAAFHRRVELGALREKRAVARHDERRTPGAQTNAERRAQRMPHAR